MRQRKLRRKDNWDEKEEKKMSEMKKKWNKKNKKKITYLLLVKKLQELKEKQIKLHCTNFGPGKFYRKIFKNLIKIYA